MVSSLVEKSLEENISSQRYMILWLEMLVSSFVEQAYIES
jgi:hypothetical protein